MTAFSLISYTWRISWRINGNQCEKRTYTCGYETYPNCPSTQIYTSESQCNANIVTEISKDCYYYLGTGNSCLLETYSATVCPASFEGNTLYESKSVCEDNIDTTGDTSGTITDSTIVATNIKLPPDGVETFKITLENKGDSESSIFVEAGFYTQNYALDVAKLPQGQVISGAIVPVGQVSSVVSCVPEEGFVKTVKVTLPAGGIRTITIKVDRLPTLVTLPIAEYVAKDIRLVSFVGLYESCCVLEGDSCKEGTGGYINYATDYDYDPNYIQSYLIDQDITCGAEIYGKYDAVNFLIAAKDRVIITRDYTECISKDFGFGTSKSLGLGDARKISLTEEEIGEATSIRLLSSACKFPEQCLPRDNFTTTCVSISKLKSDEILFDSDEKDFFDKAEEITQAGLIGGSLGGLSGIAFCSMTVAVIGAGATFGAASLLAIPAAAVTCATVGALIGAGITVSGTFDLENLEEDQLLIDLNARNANEVGICTARPESSGAGLDFLKGLAFFDVTGDGKKDGTDGLIILIGGLVGIFLIIGRRWKSKKKYIIY